jgi:hypothetical protein
MSDYRKNRTYEEIYGEEMAKELKRRATQRWLGESNPNYIEIDMKVVNELILQNLDFKEIAKFLNTRYATLWYKIKLNYKTTPTKYKEALKNENLF